jgi:hypothetical protein
MTPTVPCALCHHFDQTRVQAAGWVQHIRLAKGAQGFSLCRAHLDQLVDGAPIRSVLKEPK